ncbi:MAG: hypothetical protein HYY16_07395, partial [Planctomycetes bacterium]|nr:hypothetical protein [Planctomycetota bacterium]
MDPRRLEELIAGHFDGTLTDEQRAELESVLRTDPNARRLLARAAQTHLDLSLLLGHRLPDIPAARGNRRIAYGAAAAILLVAAGALLWVVRPPAAPQTYRLIEETGLRDVHALPYGRDILAGMGTTLPLDGGAVEFLAPTIVSLSEERVDLKAGHARFRLSGGNARLCVATPAGTLRDIGTTFEVQVSRRMGEEDLVRQFRAGIVRTFVTAVVLTGAVEFQSTAQDPPRKLTPEMGTVPLSADASIGRVRDREGIAGLKPVMADRWTVAEENAPLERGTWVRTGTRGANAVTLTLSNQAQLILGPATLVELVDPENVRLVQGELEVTSPQKANVKVTGPGATSLDVSGTQVLRARDGKLSPLESQPRWLEGYKNNASTEALGSLLADVDGRNVPLEIGTHIVTVDIRDQIARTEIEESFINTTDRRLEGVFYFPLPQDASISGFGMWIGDELVHADIVEKQRAREIYETILSERRDPGLLEWTGGNIFKARVFPIDREKRIKISYTEVLPKTGGAYRYFYRLQSEMLRLHPLKKLKIDVKIHSQEALQSVTCPSHDCRIATTESSARVEFEAGEYVPDRDFEVRVAPKRETPPISVVTHRRGNDGTFLMFINPIERDTESRAEPLTLLVMADTSGSMAGAPREAQLAFVEALLSSLSEKDRFNLLTCDVTSGWAFEQPRENTKENREAALGVLEKRHPLGWSDLDQAFDSVLQRVQEGDHVVYVGDGAITTGDAHPVAFAKRLRRRYQVGTFHAVAPGSSYESVVLKTIAECGGGSWRVVGGGQDPAQAADRLLREIASPGLRGARLSFTGVPVAAVYPEMLPNLPSDMQQIIVGRYDPTAGAALGKVTVRGTLDGKPVEHGGEFVLGAADAGNSFIPRLWARHHLDHLLAQGDTPEIRDRIIALSEDYQIITPYTSFLVLESDADRERFKVRKRFLMRDGEEFFAKGRENADFELGRKQMLAAKLWRRELRNHVLAWLAEMGRESARGYDIRGVGITDVDEYGAGAFRGGERLERDFREPVSGPVEVFADLDEMNELAENEVPSGQWAAGYDLKKVPPAGGKLSRNKRGWDGYVVTEESSPSGFDSLFPTLPDPPQNPAEPEWPQEVLDIIRSLDRRPKISPLTDGLKIVVASERSSVESILSKDAWVVTPLSEPGFDFEIPWCTTTERGVIRATWLLGRVRDKLDGDAVAWPGPFPWYFGEILQSHATCRLELKALEGGRVELTLRHPQSPALATVLLIDPAEATILEVRQVMGNFTSIVSYEDFVEVAGALWPQTQVSRDGNGKIIGAPVTISVSVIAQKDLAAEIDARLAIRKQALLLGKTPQTIAQAKQAVKDGKDRLEDRWVLLREYATTQQWGKAELHLAAIAKIASDKLGLVAIRLTWHRESRRGEELRGLIMEA